MARKQNTALKAKRMTVAKLVAAAAANCNGPVKPEMLTSAVTAEFLRGALDGLLTDIDYEADLTTPAAVAARMLATLIHRHEQAAAN